MVEWKKIGLYDVTISVLHVRAAAQSGIEKNGKCEILTAFVWLNMNRACKIKWCIVCGQKRSLVTGDTILKEFAYLSALTKIEMLCSDMTYIFGLILN